MLQITFMDDPSQQVKAFLNNISVKLINLLDRFKMGEHSFVLSVAVIIGILGGFGAVGIQFAIEGFQHLFWGGDFNLSTVSSIDWFWKLIIPTCGGIFVGLIIQFVAREAKGHGVPEVMEAISLRNGIIRPRVVLAKLLASAVYIASGGSVGREGPVIQVGSATGSTIGQFFRSGL
jgi:CIC family chloride channel protein